MKQLVLRAIADDYENFPMVVEQHLSFSEDEIAEALLALVEEARRFTRLA
jgi:hypothetical protein